MIKPTHLAMLFALPLALVSCAEQYESIYLDTQEGELRVQLQNLHPMDIDSAVFWFTGTGPLVHKVLEGQELVLDLKQVPVGQHLTEVQVFSHMVGASQDKNLAVKRLDILNTYILLHTPSLGISIPGPGDEQETWTSTVEAYSHEHPERLEVQTLPLTAFTGVSVDSSKTIQHLVLTKIATVAGRKAEPVFLRAEKTYTADEFYRNSSNGRTMYDHEGFLAFYHKLKDTDLRKMTYKYKVQYTDGAMREFQFSVRMS